MKHDKIHRVIPTGLLLSEMDMIQIKGGDGDDKPPFGQTNGQTTCIINRYCGSANCIPQCGCTKVCAYSWREFQAYAHVLLNFNKV